MSHSRQIMISLTASIFPETTSFASLPSSEFVYLHQPPKSMPTSSISVSSIVHLLDQLNERQGGGEGGGEREKDRCLMQHHSHALMSRMNVFVLAGWLHSHSLADTASSLNVLDEIVEISLGVGLRVLFAEVILARGTARLEAAVSIILKESHSELKLLLLNRDLFRRLVHACHETLDVILALR